MLQWEDFKQHNAIRLLDRYRHRFPSFNDDIQGTAAVVLAGILAAMRCAGRRTCAISGWCSLGAGRRRHRDRPPGRAGHARDRASAQDVRTRDRDARLARPGLRGRDHLDDDKRPFALPARDLAAYGFAPAATTTWRPSSGRSRPTILIGTTSTPGTFTEAGDPRDGRAHAGADRACRCPTRRSKAEAVPADVLAWSEGRALVATGSPFDPVRVGGRRRVIGQANNVFIFPGVGLGTIASRARDVTDPMFLAAATTLAGLVPRRPAGRRGALPAARRAAADLPRHRDRGRPRGPAGRRGPDGPGGEEAVDATVWTPEYQEVGRANAVAELSGRPWDLDRRGAVGSLADQVVQREAERARFLLIGELELAGEAPAQVVGGDATSAEKPPGRGGSAIPAR